MKMMNFRMQCIKENVLRQISPLKEAYFHYQERCSMEFDLCWTVCVCSLSFPHTSSYMAIITLEQMESYNIFWSGIDPRNFCFWFKDED